MSLPQLANPRKRVLLSPISNEATEMPPKIRRLTRRSSSFVIRQRAEDEAGRLFTVDSSGKKSLVIQCSKSLSIGRSPSCDYVLKKSCVSFVHCQLRAVLSDLGQAFVLLSDSSSNGTLWNNTRISHKTIVLSDKDEIEIAGQVFVFNQNGTTAETGGGSMVGRYWVTNRVVGSGSFGHVHLSISTESHLQYACKKIKKDSSKRGIVEREVAILRSLNHPNINKVQDVIMDEQFFNVFLELVSGGDLFTYLTVANNGRVQAPETKFIFYQILQGLLYLHNEKNVSHRDLKLENIILHGPGPFPRVMIADFGAARYSLQRFSSITGTLVYLSPEVLTGMSRKEGYDGKKLDMWSLGILLVMLLTGSHPFDSSRFEEEPSLVSDTYVGKSLLEGLGDAEGSGLVGSRDGQTCSNIISGASYINEAYLGSDSKSAMELIGELLHEDPVERTSASQVMKSRWIHNSRDELWKLWQRTCESPPAQTLKQARQI